MKKYKAVFIVFAIAAAVYALTLIPPAYTPPPHNEVALHNYNLAIEHFNKKDFTKAVGYFAQIKPDDTLYKQSQLAIDHCYTLIAAKMMLDEKMNRKTWQEKFIAEYSKYSPDIKLSIDGSTLYLDAPSFTEDLILYFSLFTLQFQRVHCANTNTCTVRSHIRINNKITKTLQANESGLINY